jgi:muramidase (phage lysozyme)
MAINPQKLLPPSSSSLVKVGKIKTSKKSENNSTDSTNIIGAIKKELEKIKENLEKIYSLVLDNNKLTEKDLEVKRLSAERLKFAEKEKRLETKDPEKKDEKDDKSIPKLGIFDRINRFITFTLLGWVAVRLVKYLPKLIEFTKNIGPVMEFFSSFTANIFTGIVDFIDWGYKAHDNFREFIGELGGEPFQKAFDDFSSNLNKFVNLAIIAGIAASGGTDFGLGKKPGKLGSRLGGGSSQKLTIQERVKNSRIRNIQRKYGPSARKIYENALNNGKTPQQAEAAVRKGIKKGVSIRPGADSLSAKTAKKGSVLSRGVGKSVNRLSTKVLGKAGKKLVGKAFGRIPIIGGLVSFIISVVSGEDPGRAAAKAVGSTIGAGLGTFIPIPFAGTILGGILGDIVGGALYDTLIGNKQKEPEVVAKRRGGQVTGKKGGGRVSTTRGGKQVGGAIKRQVRRVLEPPKATPISPGRSVGGKEKIQEMFPEAEDDNTMNPYGHLTETSKMMTDTNWLGPVFNLFAKTQAGDLPSQSDYKRVGTSINGWVNAAIAAGGGSSSGYSNGGVVNNSGIGDISKWLEKSAEELFQSKAQQAIRDLRKNLTLEPLTGDYDEGGDGGGGGGGGGGGSSASFGTKEERAMLDAIAYAEGTDTPNGYKTFFTGKVLEGPYPTEHPNIIHRSGRYASTAFGRYQFLTPTWNEAKQALGLSDMSPKNQDKAAIWLARRRKVDADLLRNEGMSRNVMAKLAPEWASFPTLAGRSYYGQPNKDPKNIADRYQRSLSGGSSTALKGPEDGFSAKSRGTPGTFIQGSTGRSTGDHFHIGPTELYDPSTDTWHGKKTEKGKSDARDAAFKVAKGLISNGIPFTFTNARVSINPVSPPSDSELKNYIMQEQNAHYSRSMGGSWGGIDIAGARGIRLPLSVGRVIDGGHGFGNSAKILGTQAFVAHGAEGSVEGGSDDSGYTSKDSRRKSSGGGGMWGFSGFSGFGFSGFSGWGFSGFEGSSKNRRKGRGSGSADSADIDPSLEGKDKKIYLHWNAAPYTNPIGPYHTVFLGDGKKVQHADYNTRRDHTYGRNTNSIGLAIAAMHEGSPTNWKNAPTSAQITAMVSEAANIAKSMGWNASDINKSNIMTHAEAAFLDGYGFGSGEDQTKWDLITLRGSDATPENLKKPGSKGGNELRGMIRQKMKYGGPVGESNSENTRNSLNYKPPYESHQETQVVFVPIEKIVQVPVLDSGNKAISFGGVNSIIDPTKYSFSYTG